MKNVLGQPRKRLDHNGFTIVELLIVIVIIGILAALVIVVYSGIQQRAENAKTISAVQAYKKALIQYAAEKGSYPPAINGYGWACLGEDYPTGTCNNAISQTTVQAIGFNNQLRPYFGGGRLPMPSTSNMGAYTGAVLAVNTNAGLTLDGLQYPYFLEYTLVGAGTKCPIGPLVSGWWATFTSTEPASGITGGVPGGSVCWIKMPDPATF